MAARLKERESEKVRVRVTADSQLWNLIKHHNALASDTTATLREWLPSRLPKMSASETRNGRYA